MDGVAVRAEGFGLRGPRGWAFRGVGLDAPPGSLVAVEGPSGSGRTSLLLALTGRMKATEGTASVGTARLPRGMAAVRRVSALANVSGVTDLDPALTVGEHLRERALLQRRYGGSVRALLRPRSTRAGEERQRLAAALGAAGLDLESLPKGARTAVRDLERLESLRLSIALALLGRPLLLGVDDADLKLSGAERAAAWDLLASLAAAGTTVLTVCAEAPEGTVRVSTERATDGPEAEVEAEAEPEAGLQPADRPEAPAERPEAERPEAERPAEAAPDTAGPDAAAPDTATQDPDAPEPDAPDTPTPDKDAPTATPVRPEHGEEPADALAETGRA